MQPKKQKCKQKYRYIILHSWGKGINFPFKARMRTALILKFYQLPQRMCLVTMHLMVLDYKDPITRFLMEWRKDPSCTTIYGFFNQDFTVSIFLIYRRFLN